MVWNVLEMGPNVFGRHHSPDFPIFFCSSDHLAACNLPCRALKSKTASEPSEPSFSNASIVWQRFVHVKFTFRVFSIEESIRQASWLGSRVS